MITNSALKNGFSGGMIVDYPNSRKARKYYLFLMAGYSEEIQREAKQVIERAAKHEGMSEDEESDSDGDEEGEQEQSEDDESLDDMLKPSEKKAKVQVKQNSRKTKMIRKMEKKRKGKPMLKSRKWISNKKER